MESYHPKYDKNGLLHDTFWKKPQRALPGRTLQTSESPKVMSGSSYQQFQASVNDAWDLGDDDIISGIADTRISKTISQTAALNVINNHRNSTKNIIQNDDKTETESKKELPAGVKSEVKRVSSGQGGSSGPLRHYPGRPRPVKLSAFSSREESSESKIEKFQQLLESQVLDLDELKQLSWSSIPVKVGLYKLFSSNYNTIEFLVICHRNRIYLFIDLILFHIFQILSLIIIFNYFLIWQIFHISLHLYIRLSMLLYLKKRKETNVFAVYVCFYL